MIFVRRGLAVLIVLVFPLVFLLTLLGLRVNATVLEPRFYTSTLSRVDAYNFLYDEALPLAIYESGMEWDDMPLGLELTPEGLSDYVRETIPPEWLEENVSGVIEQVVPYATGRSDTLTVHVRFDDRVEAAAAVIREIVDGANVHDFLIEDVIRGDLERNADAFQSLPMGLSLTVDQVADGAKEIVPEEWLKAQVLGMLDEIIPYVTARTDGFRVVIPLQDRADTGIVVLERWFVEGLDNGAYDFFMEEQIAPVVRSGVSGDIRLPFGAIITQDEVMEAVADAVHPEWVGDRMSETVVAMGAYLTGRSDTLLVVVSLEDRLELAAESLVDLADSKMSEAYHALEYQCTMQQMQEWDSSQEPPECKVPGMSYEDIKDRVPNALDRLAAAMIEPMPKSIELSERTLLHGFGEDDIQNVRRLLREGFVFEDEDLRAMLLDQGGPELASTFDDVRTYMHDGFRFTEDDLRTQQNGEFEALESVRATVGTARSFLFLLFIVPLGMVASTGFLGGQSWGTRLVWAGAPLVAGGLLVGIAAAVGAAQVRSLTDPAILGMEANQAIISKLLEVRDELVGAFITPLAVQSAIAGVFGVGVIGGGIYLERRLHGAEPGSGETVEGAPEAEDGALGEYPVASVESRTD